MNKSKHNHYRNIVLLIVFLLSVNMAFGFLHSNVSFNGANNGTFGANSCAQLWDDAYSTLGSWDNPTKWMSFIEGGGSSNNGCYIYENRTLQWLYFGVLISDTGSVVCSNCKLWASYDNVTWRLCRDISNSSYTADGWTNYTLQSNESCAGNSLYLDVHSTQYARMGEISVYAADFDNSTKTMIINFTYPTNTTDILINSTGWVFNVSANSTNQNVTNISINVYNSSLGLITHNSILHNTSGSTFLNYTIAGMVDGLYYYNATAYGSGYVNASTPTYNFTIDTTAPTITNLNFTVNKVYAGNIEGSLNISDPNIHSFNITLDGSPLKNWSNINGTHYVYNLSLNASSLKVGQHNLSVTAWDGHTDKQISNYEILERNSDKLRYNTGKNIIQISSDSINNVMDTKKEVDRYTFDFTPATVKTEYNFIVSSSNECTIVHKPHTEYKKWLICGNANWIDFYSVDLENDKVKYEYLNEEHTEILVTVKVKDTKTKYTFKSIGDLNSNIVSYTFFTVNATVTYTTPIVETLNNSIFLYVNITNTTYNASDVNATIDYNYTTHNATKSSNATTVTFEYNFFTFNVTGNQTFNFTWNITARDQNYTTLNNQTVTDLNISFTNCTKYTLLNFTVLYEDKPTVNFYADYEYLINVWVNPGVSIPNVTYNGTLLNQSYFSICSDINTTLYYNVYLRYLVNGGFKHRYYLYLETYNGSVYNVKGGNYNVTTDTSQLNLIVRDISTYAPLENIVATLQRRYIGEDIYRNVQWDKSDDYGTLYFNIREADTDYKLIFRNTSNALIKTSNDLKFLCDSGRCDLTYLLDLSGAEVDSNVEFNYSYNKTTGVLNVTWLDTTNLTSSIRLLVTKETNVNHTTICNVTGTGSSGNTGCNISQFNGTILVKLYGSASPEKPKLSFFIDRLTGTKLYNYIGEKTAIFLSFLLSIGVMSAGVATGGVGAIISGVLVLIVLKVMGLTSIISTAFIIAAIILGLIIALKVRY